MFWLLIGLIAAALIVFAVSWFHKLLFPSKNIAKLVTGTILASLLVIFSVMVVQSPQYSVYQMYAAAHNRDYAKFSKYMDVDGVVDNLTADASKSQGSGSELTATFVQALLPGIKSSLKTSIKQTVEKGEYDKPNSNLSPWSVYQKAKVTRHGNTADIKMGDVTMTARKQGWHWQVFTLAGSGVLAADDKTAPTATATSSKQVKFGSRNDITLGWWLTVGAPAMYVSTNQYETPSAGNKYVTTEVTYENTSKESGTYTLSNLKLRDSQNHEYEYAYSGKEPSLSGSDLEAGGKVTGFVTFEVPEAAVISSLKYSNGTSTLIFQ